jgi:hypothetical protein
MKLSVKVKALGKVFGKSQSSISVKLVVSPEERKMLLEQDVMDFDIFGATLPEGEAHDSITVASLLTGITRREDTDLMKDFEKRLKDGRKALANLLKYDPIAQEPTQRTGKSYSYDWEIK